MAAAAGPLEIATRAVVEILSFWVWATDIVYVGDELRSAGEHSVRTKNVEVQSQ